MNAWIIYSQVDFERNSMFCEEFQKKGKEKGIDFKLLIVDDIDFGVDSKGLYCRYKGENFKKPDFIINRTIYPLLTMHLEQMGYIVFNNAFINDVCNDKAKTIQYIGKATDKIVLTTFVKYNYTMKYIKQCYKTMECFVVKEVDGHGGKQVYLCGNGENAIKEKDFDFDKIIHKDLIVQPLIKGQGQDVRVYILGNKIKKAIIRTSKDGFKSNFSLGGDVAVYHLNKNEIKQIENIINYICKTDISHMCNKGLSLAGIDFIINDKGELLFNEIEDVVGCRMLYSCTDIDIVDEYLDYCYDAVHTYN